MKRYNLKQLTDILTLKHNIDFKKSSTHELRKQASEKYKEGLIDGSYSIDLAADIKDLLTDNDKNNKSNKFYYINVLLEEFFSIKENIVTTAN